MKILVKRIAKKDTYTIGKMYIDGKYFCDTLEDKDRGLTQTTPLSIIKSKKVPGQTAIPTGTYKVTLDTISPKFSTKDFYKNTCSGKLPRLLNVPGFSGILIHVGDGPKGAALSSGCILVGKNTVVGQLTEGKYIFTSLYKELLKSKDNITISIE